MLVHRYIYFVGRHTHTWQRVRVPVCFVNAWISRSGRGTCFHWRLTKFFFKPYQRNIHLSLPFFPFFLFLHLAAILWNSLQHREKEREREFVKVRRKQLSQREIYMAMLCFFNVTRKVPTTSTYRHSISMSDARTDRFWLRETQKLQKFNVAMEQAPWMGEK